MRWQVGVGGVDVSWRSHCVGLDFVIDGFCAEQAAFAYEIDGDCMRFDGYFGVMGCGVWVKDTGVRRHAHCSGGVSAGCKGSDKEGGVVSAGEGLLVGIAIAD